MATLNLFLETPLTPDAELQPIRPKVGAAGAGAAREELCCCMGRTVQLPRMHLQRVPQPTSPPPLPPTHTSSPQVDLLLFFKQYSPDPQHPRLSYAGRRLVPRDAKVKV